MVGWRGVRRCRAGGRARMFFHLFVVWRIGDGLIRIVVGSGGGNEGGFTGLSGVIRGRTMR